MLYFVLSIFVVISRIMVMVRLILRLDRMLGMVLGRMILCMIDS